MKSEAAVGVPGGSLAREGLAEGTDHFMPVELLESQLETLEEPAKALTAPASWDPARIVVRIRSRLYVVVIGPSDQRWGRPGSEEPSIEGASSGSPSSPWQPRSLVPRRSPGVDRPGL